MVRYQKKTPTTSTTTPPLPGGDVFAGRQGSGSGTGSSNTGLGVDLDITGIFGSVATADGVQNNIVMNGDELAHVLNDPTAPLYVRRTGNVIQLSTQKSVGFKPAATRLKGMFAKNAAGRREGLLKLQYYMEVMGLYGSNPPPLGTWSPTDYAALKVLVSQVQDAGRTTSTAGGQTTAAAEAYKGTASGLGGGASKKLAGRKPNAKTGQYLDLGGYLKDQAEKTIAVTRSNADTAARTGGGGVITTAPKEEIGSTLDETFRQLIGRRATDAEKSRFVAAFQADQIAAGRASLAAQASTNTPEGQMQTEMERLQHSFEQAKVDPLVKFNNTWVRASQVPQENRADIIRKYNVDYNAINRFYASSPQAGGGKPTVVVSEPNLAASAEAAAKANPNYMPYQMGSMGQAILDMFQKPTYRVNPDIRTG